MVKDKQLAKDKNKEAKSTTVAQSKLIPGLGISREQLLGFLKAKKDETEQKPAFMRYLYDIEDWMNEGALVTENPPRMVINKVRMKIILAAADPTRTKSLIQVFLEEYNKEMVGFERKGRLEGLGALQALFAESEDERAISIGR